MHVRAEREQPFGKPRSLKARMARKPDALPFISLVEHGCHQTFQGAAPEAQRLSS